VSFKIINNGKRIKAIFHNTTPDLQDQDQDKERPQCTRPRPIFFRSQTGLVLRPTVSDHITDRRHHDDDAHNDSKKLSWCWQTRVTRLLVSQGHQAWYHSIC